MVTFINKGRIVQSGRVEDLNRRFASKTLRVEFTAPVAEGAIKRLQTEGTLTGYRIESERAYLLDFDGTEETRKLIVDACYSMGLRSIQDMVLGLEQAFMELVGEPS